MASRRIEVLKNHLQGVPPTIPTACTVSSPAQVQDLPVSAEDLYQYQEKGFFVRRRLYNLEELAGYKQRFSDLCDGSVDRGLFLQVIKDVASLQKQESEFTINKIQNFGDDSVLSEYFSKPAALDIVQALIGDDIMAMHTMLINKPPDTGKKTSRHPLHQDLWYFPFRPADKVVCSWTAMEKVHRANGCLVVYPGTHKLELQDHDYPEWEGGVNKLYHGIKNIPSGWEPLYLEMEPGDTVFFHPLLFHGSGANTTSGFRKAISCHYANANCHYIDVSDLPQKAIAKEVEAVVKKRNGLEMSYVDMWRYRGVLVRGERINL